MKVFSNVIGPTQVTDISQVSKLKKPLGMINIVKFKQLRCQIRLSSVLYRNKMKHDLMTSRRRNQQGKTDRKT